MPIPRKTFSLRTWRKKRTTPKFFFVVRSPSWNIAGLSFNWKCDLQGRVLKESNLCLPFGKCKGKSRNFWNWQKFSELEENNLKFKILISFIRTNRFQVLFISLTLSLSPLVFLHLLVSHIFFFSSMSFSSYLYFPLICLPLSLYFAYLQCLPSHSSILFVFFLWENPLPIYQLLSVSHLFFFESTFILFTPTVYNYLQSILHFTLHLHLQHLLRFFFFIFFSFFFMRWASFRTYCSEGYKWFPRTHHFS